MTDKGKDARGPGWFWADNKVVDAYAAKIGIHALGVYMVLVRHLNSDDECWPSGATIAKKLGISQRTVVKAIQTLAAEKLIEITPREAEGKGQISNLYTVHRIGAPSDYESPPPMQEVHRGMNDVHSPPAPDAYPPMQEVHTNKTKGNKTQGTSGGVARTNGHAAADQNVVDRLQSDCGQSESQARRYALLQEFTPEKLDRIATWYAAKKDDRRVESAGRLLASFLKVGQVPDDLPPPPKETELPIFDESGKIQNYAAWEREYGPGVKHLYHRG
jgi:hypothetical protein